MCLKSKEVKIIKAEAEVNNLHFWSWGYGYLYTVKTKLVNADNEVVDEVNTRTGFRKQNLAKVKSG